jgi:hypothetical protein
MKLQKLALGLALACAGSAFAAAGHDTTVTRVTPQGSVTKHVMRTSDRHHPARRMAVVDKHPRHDIIDKKVVVVHPQHHHRHVAVNRHVVVRHQG